MKKILSAAIVAASMFAASSASAATVTYTFQNPQADLPTNMNHTVGGTCGGIRISVNDLCAIDQTAGLEYTVDGLTVTATSGTNGGLSSFIMQDLNPRNSGLAILTEGESDADDQIQFDRMESIVFTFASEVALTMIDFNAGGDVNCATPGSEGPCGTFSLFVDGMLAMAGNAVDNLSFMVPFIGEEFEIVATGPAGSGFAIGALTVETPLPAALPFFAMGVAAYGASKRRKKTA